MGRLAALLPSAAFLVTLVGHVRAWSCTKNGLGTGSLDRPSLVLHAVEKQRYMVDFIDKPMGSTVGDDPPNVPPEQDELAGLVKCIAGAADGRKADNIVALRVSSISSLTSFMVVLSGNSRPQNQAIAAAIKDDVEEEFGLLPAGGGPEGTADSGWMVLDYGSVMVHVMTPKSRLFYNIEGQWANKGGEYMDLAGVLLPNAPFQSTTMTAGTMELPENEDPFWS